MNGRILTVLGLSAVIAAAGVAELQPVPSPALRSDFAIVMKQLDIAASKKLGLKPTEFKGGEGAITRAEFAAELDGLLAKYREKFRLTPRPADTYADQIDEYNPDQATRDSLRNLSRWGVIGPVSPLVTNKSATLSEDELGDAIGYFYSRVMHYTHQPDPKWSGNLQSE